MDYLLKCYNEIVGYITNVQAFIAIMIGMLVQFIFEPKKTMHFIFMLIISSILVSVYIVQPLIIMFNIEKEYEYLIAPAYALSTILSISIVSILVNLSPEQMRKIIMFKIGIKKD